MSVNRLQDYIAHIRSAAEEARSFVEGMSRDEFGRDVRTQRAVVMDIVIIGEAATMIMKTYPEFTESNPNLPWLDMREMRNRIAHGYFSIDWDVVWETVQVDLPDLLQDLNQIDMRGNSEPGPSP